MFRGIRAIDRKPKIQNLLKLTILPSSETDRRPISNITFKF